MSTATPPPAGALDFGRSFTFVTEDPGWVRKILIGGVFTLACAFLVGVPLVLGYFARTLRNVVQGEPRPLPEWDDLGGLFGEGLRLAAVYILYTLGATVVLGALAAALVLPVAALSASEVPLFEALGLVGVLGIVAFAFLAMAASLALSIYLPAALVRTALRGTVADGFAWREVLDFIQANLGNYLVSLAIYLLASFLAQLGFLLCCVGIFPAAFWCSMVLAVALGQTVRLSRVPV